MRSIRAYISMAAAAVMLCAAWSRDRTPPAHWPARLHASALGPGLEWGVHNSYARHPLSWFGNRAQPLLQEQYQRGARLFEIDAYWFFFGYWLVAHVPFIDQISHVETVSKASCLLRRIGADNALFLDIKSFFWWPSCGAVAVHALLDQLQSCHALNPLTIMVDVSCNYYSNVACALAMQNATVPNTTLLFRGIHFLWLKHDCGTAHTSQKETCLPFTANMTTAARFRIPVLAQCHHCTRRSCASAMARYNASRTYVQIK